MSTPEMYNCEDENSPVTKLSEPLQATDLRDDDEARAPSLATEDSLKTSAPSTPYTTPDDDNPMRNIAAETMVVLRTNTGCLKYLPLQRKKIVARKGVTFTMMVAGESGLGKTTFVNTLFRDQITDTSVSVSVSERVEGSLFDKTTKLNIRQVEYTENGFTGRFTIVESSGLGDYTNNKSAWLPLCQYIDSQHALYMCEEEQPFREELVDTRVHVCLYFIYPSGHGLLPLDIITMQELSQRVNLIPVVAKADSFCKEDLLNFKRSIRQAIQEHEISVFCPPANSSVGKAMEPIWPYAVIASEKTVNVNGEEVRGRRYRWGVSLVDDPEHCDFTSLSEVLMGKNMLDLIDTTHEVHYERQRRLLMQQRLKASTDLQKKEREAEESVNALTKGPTEKKSVTFMSPVVDNADTMAIDRYNSLELLAKVMPFGYDYLRKNRLEHNSLFLQRVRCAQEEMGRVSALQETHFKKWNEELRQAKEACQHELDGLYREVESLQHAVGALDSRRRHH